MGSGTLNLRSRPDPNGTVIASMPNGANVRVFGKWNGWGVVHYGNFVGYAALEYLQA